MQRLLQTHGDAAVPCAPNDSVDVTTLFGVTDAVDDPPAEGAFKFHNVTESNLSKRQTEQDLALTPRCQTPSNPAADALLSRLQAGSQWLTAQHQAWIDGAESAVSDQKFSVALAGWAQLEQELRALGFEDCIFGVGGRCPDDAPVSCDFCVTD
jgi:hypothetical protein